MNKQQQNNTNISHPDYNPTKDPDVQPDTITEAITEWKNELPYNTRRYIMIVGFTILIILVVYLGYARGALDVCNDLEGRLEVGWKIECLPSQYTQQDSPVVEDMIIPFKNVD